MELACPKCGAAISRQDVALQQGIARCGACNEYFRLAAHLRTDEEIRRSAKPFYSKVIIEQGEERSIVRIPARGWNTGLWFPVIFLGGALAMAVFSAIHGNAKGAWFMCTVFALASLAMALPSFAHITLLVGPSVAVTWRVLGLARTKRGRTQDLVKITENVVYRRNYQPVYGVGLFFKDGSHITFGSALKEEERKWLIGELQELSMRSQFDHPRTRSERPRR